MRKFLRISEICFPEDEYALVFLMQKGFRKKAFETTNKAVGE